ncbi:MAG: carboxypeptidase regulatory-like domain-containing protein [Deltaproteobacteria bacterium]|nr:carboxypeptidase regulatory-like domain-containing protein [Deltaproteobacteria bacterium]
MIRRVEFILLGVSIIALSAFATACQGGAVPITQESVPDDIVSFLFTPPNDSGYKQQAFVDVSLSELGNFNFNLNPSRTVTGLILNKDNLFSGMAAGLTFTPRESIPGLVVLPGTTSSRKDQRNGKMMPFSIGLTAGTYDVLVTPDDPMLPPIRYVNVKVDWSNSEKRLDFHYPSTSELNTLSGTVRLEGASGTEIAGLMVQAYDMESGKASTIARTGGPEGKGGDFKLAFPPGAGTYTLRVWSPSETDPQKRLYFPTIEFNNAVVFEQDPETGKVKNRQVTGKNIVFPSGLTNQPVTVRGKVTSSADDMPLKDVTVKFSSDLMVEAKVFRASFEASMKTDENGEYQLEILPGGSYHIMAVPPPGSDRRSTEITKYIESPKSSREMTLDIQLEKKSRLMVQLVKASSNRPLGISNGQSALVKARKIAGLGEQEIASAWTDEKGECALSLDVGVYDIIAIPPVSSNLSGAILKGYFHRGNDDSRVKLELFEGTRLCGSVLDEKGNPMGPTRVEIFNSPEDGWPAELIAEAEENGFSGNNGRFCVLVPSGSASNKKADDKK